MSATPESAASLLVPPAHPAPLRGGPLVAGTLHARDARERLPQPARPGPDAIWLAPPQLPPGPLVWLAVEGGPEAGQEDRAIRLWGLAVDDGPGEPGPEAIAADLEDPGGARAWERFVARAGEIIERHPDARWVHYSPREPAAARACAAAHGAPAGFLDRLEEAFFELRSRGVRSALRLPPESCSIRQVACLAGFRWRGPRPDPAWSSGRHPGAAASADPVERARVLRELADSNAETLLAMRAVWRWMLEQGPREHCG
jgi:hypothetical protein